MPFVKALGLSLVLLILAWFACKSSRQSSQHKLLIYTPHGQDMLRDFVARHKQQPSEAEVQFLDMGSREVLERLRAERNRPQADLWWGAAHTRFRPRLTKICSRLIAPRGPIKSLTLPATTRIAGMGLTKLPK